MWDLCTLVGTLVFIHHINGIPQGGEVALQHVPDEDSSNNFMQNAQGTWRYGNSNQIGASKSGTKPDSFAIPMLKFCGSYARI